MAAEEVLIQTRKDKHLQLNGGAYPLPTSANHYPIHSILKMMENGSPKTTINLEDLSGDPQFLVHGRIAAFRKSGSISFIKLTDTSGSMQLIVSKAAYLLYDELKLFDLGDIVEAAGWTCLSKTGEKSILVNSIRLLSKAHRPPPEKFAGIADTELKYRKRYLDLVSSEESRARFMLRSMIMRGIRKMMDHEDFIEVETSTLNSISSGANAKPFTTHHNALDIDLYLRIAPELYLKRLLVGGLEKVYEIGRNYRNEGIDTRHNPEFTMMESYQAYADFPQLLMFAKRLLENVDLYLENETTGLVKEYYLKWKAERPFTLKEFREVPMWSAVMSACQKAALDYTFNHEGWGKTHSGEPEDIENINVGNPDNPRLQLINIKGMFHALSECSSIGEKIAVLFEYVAEPFLGEDYRTADGKFSVPVFITEYPAEICPLARVKDDKLNVCDRFELFVEGRELANAFQELNDPDEQAARFQEQLETNHKDPMGYDADYVEALEHGMPPAVGFGMGIERLCMLFTNTNSIKDVILFPTLKPVHNS
jgi:lysyl-tRNA synthetase class 2